MRALSAARNFRFCVEIRNGEMVTRTRRSPDNSVPRRLPPGSSHLPGKQTSGRWRFARSALFRPRFHLKRTENRRWCFPAGPFTCVPNLFGADELSPVGGGVRVQAAAAPSSKRRTLRISGSIFSLRKLGDCSGHCTVQRMPLTRLVSWTRTIQQSRSRQTRASRALRRRMDY